MKWPVVEGWERQRAYLPLEVFETSDLRLNSVVEIAFDRGSVICVACLQTKERNAFCELNGEVFVPRTCGLNGPQFDGHVSSDQIKCLKVQSANEICVKVICPNVCSVFKLAGVETLLKKLLVGSYVKPNAVIKPNRAFDSQILTISVQNDDQNQAYLIDESTNIKVKSISSYQRYLAADISSAPHFGGLKNQVKQLESIIRHSQTKENAMRGFLVVGASGCGKSLLINKVNSSQYLSKLHT